MTKVAFVDLGQTDRKALRVADRDVDIVVLQGIARHPLWRNVLSGLARDLDLVVAGGRGPDAAMAVLTTLSLDVVNSRTVALSTPPDQRRRAAIFTEFAPEGRGQSARVVVVAVDLSEQEWQRHGVEIDQRIGPLGFTESANRIVLRVGGEVLVRSPDATTHRYPLTSGPIALATI